MLENDIGQTILHWKEQELFHCLFELVEALPNTGKGCGKDIWGILRTGKLLDWQRRENQIVQTRENSKGGNWEKQGWL